MSSSTADQPDSSATRAARWPDDDLTVVRAQTRETLELVRTLVALLLPREGGRDGPTLEELMSALIAQQADTLVLIRQLHADITALADHLAGEGGSGPNGQSEPSGTTRGC
jgi:hypothetical protein